MFIHVAIAVIPIAIYVLLIGMLRLRRRPLITTGWRDTFTLGLSLIGLVAVGPMQLFFPTEAALRWHSWVWLALILLYVLILTMIMLSTKPRLIAYGMSLRQFMDIMLSAAKAVDVDTRWEGDVLNLPTSAIQFVIEPTGSTTVHQVVYVGTLYNLQDWMAIEKEFVKRGSQSECARSLIGMPLVLGGMLLLAAAVTPIISSPQEALTQLKQFLDR
ncbi:MAG: hypothetical protein KDB03_06505 [Planctomycetales bacterium]|nr:hypothetical protein [Planctomycetales bacterium]